MQSSNGSSQHSSSHDILRTWLLGGLFIVVALATLKLAVAVFAPIFIAIIIAAILRAPVRGAMQLGLPQALSAVLVFLTFGAVIFFITAFVYDPATKWVAEFPKLVERVEDKLTPLRKTLRQANEAAQKIESATEIAPDNARPVHITQPSLLSRVFQHSRILLIQIAMVAVLAFFMLANPNPILPTRLVASFGHTGRRLRTSVHEIERQLSRYMGVMSLVNLGVGIVTGIAMQLFGMPNPVLWAVVAFLLSFIPYLGPITTAAAIAGAAFMAFDSWPQILAPVLAYLAIHVAESEFVTPILLGKFLTLHPVAIFVSVLLWSWMWGLSGAFVAVPVLVTCAIVGRNLFITERESLSDVVLARSWDEDAEVSLGATEAKPLPEESAV